MQDAQAASPSHGPSPQQYERSAYQFISFYRYASFAAAVLLMAVLPASRDIPVLLDNLIILAFMGVYTAFKVIFPTQISLDNFRSYFVLTVDAVLALGSVLFTGGLDSGLLLYSFTPVLIAASLYSERTALCISGAIAIALSIGHIALNRVTDRLVWVLEGNHLSMLAIYSVASLLVATIAYRANLNIRRRIEQSSVIEERRRLRREIHDGIAQSLGYLNLKTSLIQSSVAAKNTDTIAQDLADIKNATEEAYIDIRDSIDSLTLAEDNFSLPDALQGYLNSFRERTGIEVSLRVDRDGKDIPPAAGLQALRIAQEALRNVRKHAEATRVEVVIHKRPRAIELSIQDNGKGLTEEEATSYGHHGIEVMKERAESLGGSLAITSEPGHGTEVNAILPTGAPE